MKRFLWAINTFAFIAIASSCKPAVDGPVRPNQDCLLTIINKIPEIVATEDIHLSMELDETNVFFSATPLPRGETQKNNEQSFRFLCLPSKDLLGNEPTRKNPMDWPNISFKGRIHFFSLKEKKELGIVEVQVVFNANKRTHPFISIGNTRDVEVVSVVDKGSYISPLVLEIRFLR